MRVSSPILISICLASTMPAASAQESNRHAHAMIQQGDYVGAERMLIAEQRVAANRPEVLLNLAAVYVNTGRHEAARKLYDSVLAQSDTLMDLTRDRVVGSHALAELGLRRLAAAQISAP